VIARADELAAAELVMGSRSFEASPQEKNPEADGA
jgi:hypothetical protein